MTTVPAPPNRPLLPWFIVAVALAAAAWLGLLAFQLQGRVKLAEQTAQLAEAEVRTIEHDLEIERLLAQRLAGDTVDLDRARVAILSPANAGAQPAFAVVWSPTNGEGVLIVARRTDLPAQPLFQLQATRRLSNERLESDEVFKTAAPADFRRGLFHYRPAQPDTVSAFSLLITPTDSTAPALRFGGDLLP